MNDHITICVRNYARRSLKGDFAVIVGLKDYPYSSIVYNTADDSHMRYETKTIYSLSATGVPKGSSRFYDFGSYCAGYVTLTVPAVTEKKELLKTRPAAIMSALVRVLTQVATTAAWQPSIRRLR